MRSRRKTRGPPSLMKNSPAANAEAHSDTKTANKAKRFIIGTVMIFPSRRLRCLSPTTSAVGKRNLCDRHSEQSEESQDSRPRQSEGNFFAAKDRTERKEFGRTYWPRETRRATKNGRGMISRKRSHRAQRHRL